MQQPSFGEIRQSRIASLSHERVRSNTLVSLLAARVPRTGKTRASNWKRARASLLHRRRVVPRVVIKRMRRSPTSLATRVFCVHAIDGGQRSTSSSNDRRRRATRVRNDMRHANVRQGRTEESISLINRPMADRVPEVAFANERAAGAEKRAILRDRRPDVLTRWGGR